MKKADLVALEERLSELAEYYGRTRPSKGALRVWFDALQNESFDAVLAALTDWPKTHRQMPLADEVLQCVRRVAGQRLEDEAARNKETATGIGDMAEWLRAKESPAVAQIRAALRNWAMAQRIRDPKEWARKLKERETAGEQLGHAQSWAWRRALGEAGESWTDDARTANGTAACAS